jgi:hypothetical protein
MNNLSKILTGIVIVIVLIFVISYFGKTTDTTVQSLVSDKGVAQTTDAKYILNLLNKMNQVKLEDTIFSDKVFISLKDNSVTLVAQPVSRENPFAPVSAAELAQTATTTQIPR